MKKYIALLLVTLSILTLTACSKTEQEGPPYYFIGEVTEVYKSEGTFLVKVTDYCNYNFNSEYVIIHESMLGPRYAIGDSLKIKFNGVFLETDPPQFRNAPYQHAKE